MVEELWEASEAFIILIEITFRNISRVRDLPPILPPCTSDTWLTVSDSLSLPNRVWRSSDRLHNSSPPLSQHSASLPLLFLYLIWCNYLIIPAFVTHWSCLAYVSYSPCPSSPLTHHISLTYISVSPTLKVTVQLQIVKAHQGPLWGWWQGGRCPPWVSYITGKWILIIRPRKKDYAEERRAISWFQAVVLGVCVCPGWRDLVWTAGWHTILHGTQKHLSQIKLQSDRGLLVY